MVMLKVSIPSQIPEELFHAKGVLVLALAHNKWVPSCQMFILLSSLFYCHSIGYQLYQEQ